jgi:hypothetical protein
MSRDAVSGPDAAPPPPVLPLATACADPLDAALLAAHGQGNGRALVGLYEAAAAGADGVARAFYLTHAYVFALERGDERAAALKTALVEIGADTP